MFFCDSTGSAFRSKYRNIEIFRAKNRLEIRVLGRYKKNLCISQICPKNRFHVSNGAFEHFLWCFQTWPAFKYLHIELVFWETKWCFLVHNRYSQSIRIKNFYYRAGRIELILLIYMIYLANVKSGTLLTKIFKKKTLPLTCS